MPGPRRIELDARLLALGAGLILALLGLAALLLFRPASPARSLQDEVLREPALRAQLVEELARQSTGNYDSHPDATVGHVHLPGQRNGPHGVERINSRGMREEEYELPKPLGMIRVVILGDSFVFGWGVAAEERMGAHLEQVLRERGAGSVALEVVHLGVISWSLASECAYVLRQLETLAPDLVVQITLTNDLDDPQGIRGFGGLGNFSTQGRGPGDSLVYVNHCRDLLDVAAQNYLSRGWGFDSLTRFEEARSWLAALRQGMAKLPGHPRHLLLVHWHHYNPVFHARLGRSLEPESLFYLPVRFWNREEYHNSPEDLHWSPAGHRAVARILYTLIRERGLLPLPNLERWPEAEEETRALAEEGWKEAEAEPRLPSGLKPSLEPADLDDKLARQILGGLDREGLVSPYASILLRSKRAASELRVTGQFLPDRVLAGKVVRIFVDEFEVGQLVVAPGEPFDFRAPLPAEVGEREASSVRFLAEDFVYRGSDLRHCVVWRLDRVALE